MQGRTRAEAEVMDLQRELAALRTRSFTPSTEGSEDGQVEEQQIVRDITFRHWRKVLTMVQDDLSPNAPDDQVTEENERLKAELVALKATLKGAEKRMAKLEKERDLKEPLYQVGVNVRLGCLEKAKEALLPRYTADSGVIERRNAAAHEGNFRADLSLLMLDVISLGAELQVNTFPYALWTEVYGILPSSYESSLSLPLTIIDAMDNAFTILATKLARSSELTRRREACRDAINDILDHWFQFLHDFPDSERATIPVIWTSFCDDEDENNEDASDDESSPDEYDDFGFKEDTEGRMKRLDHIKKYIVRAARRRRERRLV